MNDDLLRLLLQQSLLLSATILTVAALRWACLRWFGASAAYLSWLAVPLMLLASALPQPSAASLEILAAPRAALTSMQAAVALPALEVAAPAVAEQASSSSLITPALMLAWALGAAAFMLIRTQRQWRFVRRLQRAKDQAHWSLPAGSSPGVIGLWPARLGLPEDFEQRFSAAEQALILAHESVHASRHDNAWNLLANLLCALHWFNPLAWWALSRMRKDQELSCDAAVLSGANAPEPSLYARTLLKSHGDQALPELASMWSLRHPLIERVSLLARHRPQAARRIAGRVIALCTSLAAAGIVYASQAPAPTVEAPSPHAKNPAKFRNVNYTIRTQEGTGEWREETGALSLPLNGKLYSQTRRAIQSVGDPQQWCVELMAYHFPDDTVRLTGFLLDASCKTNLTQPPTVAADGSTTSLEGKRSDGQGVAVELSATFEDSNEAARATIRRKAPAASAPPSDSFELATAKPVPIGYNRLVSLVRTRESGGLWQSSRLELDLRNDGRSYAQLLPPSPVTKALKTAQWCVGLQIEHFGDNDIRLSSRLLEPSCKGFGLAPAHVAMQDGKTVTRFEGTTDGGFPVTVEILSRVDLGRPSPTDIVNPR